MLRNLQVIIKPFPGGFHLLSANPELLKSENDFTPMRFRFNCTDPYFINYSDLPQFDLRNNLFYFNNLSPNLTDAQLILHDENYVSANNIVKISLQTIQIAPNTEAFFKDVKGNELFAAKSNHSPLATAYQFSEQDEGIIQVEPKTDKAFKVYYTNELFWKMPFGILEIFADDLYRHFATNGKVDYFIRFNKRSTVWKYILVDPVYRKFPNLTIINKKREQVFSGPQKQTVYENTEALVFESKEKLPISEFQNDSFQLIDAEDPTLKQGKIVVKNLPSASPDLIYTNTEQTDIQYSHIYI